MIITTTALAGIQRGFRKLYDGGLAKVGEPRINKFALRAPSTGAEETYGWLGALPSMRKLVGEVNIRNLVDHGWAVKNDEFDVTAAVARKDIERDKLNLYTNFFSAMGQNAGRHPDKLLAAAMVNAFDTKCYTGKNFFDTDHAPQKGKAKFTNKTTAKLSIESFVAARTNMKSRVDAEGEPVNDDPDLTLVVSPQNEALARQILEADFIQQTAKNGDAVVGGSAVTNVNKGTAKLEVWSRLSANPNYWFLFDLGAVVKPFVFQVEKETEFNSVDDLTDSHVLLKHEFLYQAYGRYNVAALVPELAYGSTGAS
ncbi:Mu-like prophage major head subunit gpT family protein [Geminisphaera colitermitum]|uniref:Mu-like prophage major head subunit gpT family protein n=1 Tax=Geminisphaera colitermitum TaxID=1148786 RepID=UPI000158D3F5|nr:Mu-like prophage major head subunit gpT family protein [Geminisphaera colitermitum]